MVTESVGGYRLVRKLGAGSRAEVFLGYPTEVGSQAGPAALKIYHPGVAHDQVLREAEALERGAGDHVVELIDVGSSSHGAPVLILERLSAGSLRRVLADRASLRAGETITVLAPIAQALDRLHHAGVVHGSITLDSVLFDSAGTPALAGFGRASLIPVNLPPALLEAEPTVRRDLHDFAAVARGVLERVGGAESELLATWIATGPTANSSEWLDSLVSRLFALADPEPVEIGRQEPTAVGLPNRMLSASQVPHVAPAAPALATLGLPEWADSLIPSRESLSRLGTSLRRVRPLVWIAAGVGCTAFLVALALVPVASTETPPQLAASPEPSAVGPSTTGATAGPSEFEQPAEPTMGDDPVAALRQLLTSRAACIRNLSVLCLDAVGQPGSSALAADQQLIRDVQQGGELPLEPMTPPELTLVERLGASALISLGDVPDSEPASILLMKGEAGWRIRDLLY